MIDIHSYVLQSLIARFMGPTWGQQDPGGPHVGHVNLAIWDMLVIKYSFMDQLKWGIQQTDEGYQR